MKAYSILHVEKEFYCLILIFYRILFMQINFLNIRGIYSFLSNFWILLIAHNL